MKLKIYKEADLFVIERINQFNHSTKRQFQTEQGLFEALDGYHDLNEYEIEVEDQLWAKIINHLQKERNQ